MKKAMKKLLACMLVVVVAVAAVPMSGFVGLELGVKVCAEDLTEGYYTYTIENGEATITDVDTAISGDIVIPDRISGYPVTSIGRYVFRGCTGLTSVKIPDSVTSISNGVFYGCSGLTSVTIGDSITTIGDFAFDDCSSLTSITIPDSVTSIGNSAFSDCKSLTSVTIPDSVTSIGSFAFYFCSNLTSVTIPNSVTSVGQSAFADCSSLTKIDVDENNRNYSSYDGVLFNKDKTELIQYPAGNKRAAYTIPFGVTNICGGAFSRCEFLTDVTLSNSVTSIGGIAFIYCKNITNVTIANSVTTIFNEAFWGCNSLLNVTIPQSVKFIGYNAFGYDEYGKKIDNFTINGYRETEAEIYAVGKGFVFNSLDVLHTHTYTSTVTTAASCTADGVTTYTCTCGDSYTKAIPATGKHTYKTTTTKATTSKDGKTVIACTVCKTVSKTKVVPKVTSFKLSATSYTYNGKVRTPTVTVKDSKDKTLKKGTDYTVSYASGRKNTGKYAVTVTLKGNYSGSKTLYFTILPGKTSSLTASQTTSSIKAIWKAVTGASGYKVVLYSAKDKVLKTADTTKTTYTFNKLSKGTTYKVKVTAYKTINGKKVDSSVYTLLTTATKPGTPTLTVTAGSKKATLKWNKQIGATGYVVYMSTSKSGKYSKVATVKGNSKVTYTKTGLAKGKTYYFKVQAYTVAGGKTINGAFSAVKSVRVK